MIRYVLSDYAAMSRWAANFIEMELKSRPDLLLCVSAGGSPTGTYQRMAASHLRNPRLFRRMRVLQIDEWGGLARGNPATCRNYLQQLLLGPLNIGDRFTGFRSDALDPDRECDRIARWLAQNGPIDVCLLGLGLNGHIALNEPGDELAPNAHVVRLTPKSLNHKMLSRLQRKPRCGLTLGMADLLGSRRILLLVSGKNKRRVLRKLLRGKVSTQLPASFLWLHPDVTIVCDKAAHG